MKHATLGFIGTRLKEAREARYLTAIALSDLIGISRQAVSQYENGIQSPRPEIMDKIANTLQLPVSYFRYPNEIKTGTIFYRSMSAATKSVRLRAENRYLWLRIIVEYLRTFLQFPNANFPEFETSNNPNDISEEQIEDLAIQTRKFWNLSNVPVTNMVLLLENNGAIVIRDELGAATLDAFSDVLSASDCPQYIILGMDKGIAVRSRFDAAHELAHRILHRNINKSYLSKMSDYSLMEKQAHRFAGAFLLPPDAFANDFYSAALDALKNLKPKWKVSIAMMIKRAEDLNFISSDQAKNLWISLSRHGWKIKEPLDDVLEIEQPQLLRQAFEMIVNEGIKTKQEILSQIPLSPIDIERLAALKPKYLMTGVQEEVSPTIRILKDYKSNHKNSSKPQKSNRAKVVQFKSKRKQQ